MSQIIEVAILENSLEVVRTAHAQINGETYVVCIRKLLKDEEFKGDLIATMQQLPDKDLEDSIVYDTVDFMKFSSDGSVWLLDREGQYTNNFPIKGSPLDPHLLKIKKELGYYELTIAMYLVNGMPLLFNLKRPIERKAPLQ